MKLAGRKAVVTGANQGFGLAAARAFVDEGAHLVICARGQERLKQAEAELIARAAGRSKVLALPADVSDQASVKNLMAQAADEMDGLDVLLANAGVYGPKGAIDEVDFDEWAQAININLNGTVLCCREALPYLKKGPQSRIVIMSGGGATKPMPYLSAYAASKAGVVRFAETLAEEVQSFGIMVNTVAPGALNTRMLDEVLAAGPEKIGAGFYQQMVKVKAEGGTPLEVGAALCVFLASTECEGVTGKLISAVWDPWQEMTQYLDDLQNTDIFTLRRIIPKERGKTWG